MGLIELVIVLAILGFAFWLFNAFVPIEPPMLKTIINAVVAIIVIIWLLSLLTGNTSFPHIRVGR
jgi:hypothetical protein